MEWSHKHAVSARMCRFSFARKIFSHMHLCSIKVGQEGHQLPSGVFIRNSRDPTANMASRVAASPTPSSVRTQFLASGAVSRSILQSFHLSAFSQREQRTRK